MPRKIAFGSKLPIGARVRGLSGGVYPVKQHTRRFTRSRMFFSDGFPRDQSYDNA